MFTSKTTKGTKERSFHLRKFLILEVQLAGYLTPVTPGPMSASA